MGKIFQKKMDALPIGWSPSDKFARRTIPIRPTSNITKLIGCRVYITLITGTLQVPIQIMSIYFVTEHVTV